VEFTGQIPPRLKLQGLLRLKRLFKRAMADRLPPEVPFEQRLGGRPKGAPQPDVDPYRLRRGRVFDPAAVSRLLAEHVTGVRSHARILWALLVFETWRSRYLGEGALV
jgi:Asparagine synthase